MGIVISIIVCFLLSGVSLLLTKIDTFGWSKNAKYLGAIVYFLIGFILMLCCILNQ